MSLIGDLILALSTPAQATLTNCLLKTKVLLYKLGHSALVDWVNNELTGYPPNAELPEYRVLRAQIRGCISNLVYKIEDTQLPIRSLSEKSRTNLEMHHLRESLAELEKLAQGKGGELRVELPLEYNGFLSRGLSNGYQINWAWKRLATTELDNVFIQVRSRLLDFLLKLQDQMGIDATDEEVHARRKQVDTASLFNGTVFGDHTNIIIGDANRQHVEHQTISAGDFEGVARILRENGVDDDDISELKSAVATDQDATELEARKFGPGVRSWISRMMTKAVDSAWQIEMSLAANLIYDSLKRYYGWP